MNGTKLTNFQNRLLALRDETTGEGTFSVKVDKTVPHEIPDEDSQPLSEMSQVIASNRNRNRATSLARIDAALAKLKNSPKEFGVCEDCGEDILIKRLELMPYVEFCAKCQESRDETKTPTRRRHLTDYK